MLNLDSMKKNVFFFRNHFNHFVDTNDVVQPYAGVTLKDSGDVANQIQEFNKTDL